MASGHSSGRDGGPGTGEPCTRLRADALACHAAALAAVEPQRLVARHLTSTSGALALRGRDGAPMASHAGPVLLVGAGKAALGMARAVVDVAGTRVRGGVVVVPHAVTGTCDGVTVLRGAHPLPDAAGVAACERLLDEVARAGRDVLVLAVVSGGASALLSAPAPGVSLADLQAVTAALLAAGADIATLNAVRRHCLRAAGGGLARTASGAAGLWALVLSDVVGDDRATIASGPTVASPTTPAEALAALARHLAPAAIPPGVHAHLAAAPPPRADPAIARARTVLVGSNADAVAAAAAEAARRGYAVTTPAPLSGDAAVAGRALAARLVAGADGGLTAVVAGGETTVRVVPGGHGGRCQQLALAAATEIAGRAAVLLAAGTDGVDGPTDAAGACVDGATVARARAAGRDPERALAATDAHALLAATGDLLVTGPSGTNVADVVVGLRG